MSAPLIREEIPGDQDAIREVNLLAFNGDGEATLADRLRNGGDVVVSLVAVEGEQIVGHILFSGVRIETEHVILPAASLAPMAVLPEYQHRGIGSRPVRAGLELCRERGRSIVIVVGHPEYYPRFGFSAELAKPLHSPYSGAGRAWMAMELVPGALNGITGRVRYPEAFDVFRR